MMRLASASMLAIALGMFLGTAALRADEAAPAAGVGTVTGTVLDADGKAASGVDVKLQAAKAGGGKKDKAPAAEDGGAKKDGGKKDGAKPAALSAKTGADGTFSIANVPVGTYNVMAKSAAGQGKSDSAVTVKAGESVNAGTITLKAAAAKAGKEGKAAH